MCPWARAPGSEPNRSGNAGRYFSVLNCASENGLSLEPPSAAERHRATLVKLIAELQAVSDALKLPLSPAERGTLRLRADLASRLIVAHEKLAKLPPDAHEQGEGLVERALREDREARQKAEARRQRAPRARRGAVRPVGLQKPPEPSPQA